MRLKQYPALARTQQLFHVVLTLVVIVTAGLLLSPAPLAAQSEPQVQSLSGIIVGAADIDVYRLTNLQEGDTLTAYMTTTSGDLDPLLMLLPGDVDLPKLVQAYLDGTADLVVANGDIAQDIADLRDEFTLAWDDDSGNGYSAALEFVIPETGDYLLLAGGSLGSLGRATSGEYQLLVGVNAPGVLEGTAVPTEHTIAVLDQTALPELPAVEELNGTLSESNPITYTLEPIASETTLYAYVEATSSELRPTLMLRDFGGKPLAASNLSFAEPTAALQFHFDEGGTGYLLEVGGTNVAGEAGEHGDFRLLVGTSAPDVLQGTAEPTGSALIEKPITVQTGIKLNRISGVDSQNESFGILGTVRMDWTDPRYAFSPDECNCTVKVFTDEDFRNFLSEVGSRWPDFTIFNQLGPRFSQTKAIAIWSDGRARYVEDFSADIQADFDFKQFPFDVEAFPIYVDMLFPEAYYVQEVLPDYTAISPEHGEDEFIISDFTTTISTEADSSAGNPISRFTFQFLAPRHLDYYIFQIFVPIGLIALISWFTFFLRDYTRRIEAAAANVLLFIAFSFSLSDNYPRLGYLTFLDAIMVVTFVINTAVILYNVYLKHLETIGQGEKADRIDHFLDWVYPVSYLIAIVIVAWLFFGRTA